MTEPGTVLTLHGADAEHHCRQHPSWPSTRFSLSPLDMFHGPLGTGPRVSRRSASSTRCHTPPSAKQRKQHSSDQAADAAASLQANASKLWGDTESHVWGAPGENDAWVPMTNTWANPCFAEQAKWLKDKAENRVEELGLMRGYPRNEQWLERREQETGAPPGPNPDTSDLNRVRRGVDRDLAHVNYLRVLTGAIQPDEIEAMTEQPEQDEPQPTVRDDIRAVANLVAIKGPGIRLTGAKRTDEPGAAMYLGVSERTVRRWRKQSIGPAFHMLGGRAWYSLEDLDSYLEIARRDPLAG